MKVTRFADVGNASDPSASGGGGPVGGDLTGPSSSPSVDGILGFPIAGTPIAGDVLVFDGTSWQIQTPPSTAPTGPAGGDLAGTYPNPDVVKVRGVAVSSTPPTAGQFLRATGSAAAAWATLSSSSLSTRWEPLTNGNTTTPELVFAAGDVIMVEVPL